MSYNGSLSIIKITGGGHKGIIMHTAIQRGRIKNSKYSRAHNDKSGVKGSKGFTGAGGLQWNQGFTGTGDIPGPGVYSGTGVLHKDQGFTGASALQGQLSLGLMAGVNNLLT